MKIWKLVSGIICCVLTIVVLLQSCAAGVGEALLGSGTVDGPAGILVAVLMLAGGIISIVVHRSNSNGGNLALIIVFLLALLVGFSNSQFYKDLEIWSFWCLICEVMAVISLIMNAPKRRY